MEGLYQNFTQHAHIIGPCQSTVSSMPQLMRMKPSVIPTCGALKPKRPSTGVPHKCVNSWKKNWTPHFLHRIRHCIHNPQAFIPRWGTHQRNQSANEINSSFIATSKKKSKTHKVSVLCPKKMERKNHVGAFRLQSPPSPPIFWRKKAPSVGLPSACWHVSSQHKPWWYSWIHEIWCCKITMFKRTTASSKAPIQRLLNQTRKICRWKKQTS